MSKREGRKKFTRTWRELVLYRKPYSVERGSLIGHGQPKLPHQEGAQGPGPPLLFLSKFVLEHFEIPMNG